MPMKAAQVTDLLWRGAETVAAAANVLNDRADIALHLPAGFHHAVVAHFRSHGAPAPVEHVDVSGGAELLAELSRIQGLEEIRALESPATRANAHVRIQSPSPLVAIRCGTPRTMP